MHHARISISGDIPRKSAEFNLRSEERAPRSYGADRVSMIAPKIEGQLIGSVRPRFIDSSAIRLSIYGC